MNECVCPGREGRAGAGKAFIRGCARMLLANTLQLTSSRRRPRGERRAENAAKRLPTGAMELKQVPRREFLYALHACLGAMGQPERPVAPNKWQGVESFGKRVCYGLLGDKRARAAVQTSRRWP